MATIEGLIATLEAENRERLESIKACEDNIDRLAVRIAKHETRVAENNETLRCLRSAVPERANPVGVLSDIMADMGLELDQDGIKRWIGYLKEDAFDARYEPTNLGRGCAWFETDGDQHYRRWNGAHWHTIDEAMVYMSECRDMWE